jgi:FlaA1/EpsC-like NDP-sugar epimerase
MGSFFSGLSHVRNRVFLVTDVMLLLAAGYFAYVLRLETFNLQRFHFSIAFYSCLAIIVIVLIFWRVGVYARYWRYASIEEMLLLAGSVTLAVLISGGISLTVTRLVPEIASSLLVPRSVPLIYLFLALAATAIPRLLVRVSARYRHWRIRAESAKRVLIAGAGDAGAMIVRELQNNPQLGIEVVGFVDDDLAKHDVRIHGVPVLGNRYAIGSLVQEYGIQEVIIAMPRASGKVVRDIVEICKTAGVATRIIPGLYSLLDGTVSVNRLRSVKVEDLLRREPIQTDTTAVGELVRSRRVLVTGGGGSIGSEICRQVLRYEPARLIVMGHGENSVFNTYNELRQILGSKGRPDDEVVQAAIADVRFPERLADIFELHRPEIVFHAAAHKHVPLMELNPAEAITNNVLGTRNLLEISLRTDVQHFVMISTDKAVNPCNVMGASKRVAELLVHQAAVVSGKPYVAVRFGNVLGSRGSVVPIFEQQVANGGPVTVTHPEMKRYFMTIPEAVQLVLQAAVLGKGGEVFVLDMGEPVRIVDLARDIIRLSGLQEGKDIDIVFTGIRPGEKLFEELFAPGETYNRTSHEKIFVACNASSHIPDQLEHHVTLLIEAALHNDTTAIIHILRALIPEYRPAGQHRV